MNTLQKWQAIQRFVGTRPDGDPGPATADAIGKKLGLDFDAPLPVGKFGWPRDIEKEMVAFYGQPGEGHTQIVPPYQFYYDDAPIQKITVHEKIAPAVLRVLNKTLAHYGAADVGNLGLDQIKLRKLDDYDGCFNDRPKKGGTSRSVHAYAAALDFCAEQNSLHQDHTTALFAKPEYVAWWEFWEAEGAVSLGRARDFDWMHVQFATLP